MILLMQEGAQSTLETIGGDFSDESDMTQAPAFEHDTQAEAEQAGEETDELRPSGVPQTEPVRTDEPDEPDADRKDGADIREESGDTAQAV